MAYIQTRESDSAIVGETEESIFPVPEGLNEFEIDPMPVFKPSWTLYKWLFLEATEEFIFTDSPMDWP